MGGKSGGGGGGQTTTSTNQPPQQVLDAYGSLINRGTQVANTPYQAYQGQQVADLTPMQNQAFGNINAAQGQAQPYIDQASGLANQSAQSTWQNIPQYNNANLQQYQNPYTQNVINSTMANINQNNAIQQQQLLGHAISSGASPFGGDRAGVAASELARQQNLASGQTIAGLENQGFQNAQSEFNTQQQTQLAGQNADANRQAQAASIQGGLGLASQGAALQGATAQLQGGTLQQQQQQAGLNAAYNQWQQQQAYPYQQTGWLGNLVEGLGSNSGGQSSTTTPGASSASQAAGLGMLGLGAGSLFSGFKRGGVPHYANGGAAPYDITTWIPAGELTIGHTMPNSPQTTTSHDPSLSGLGSMMSSIGGKNGSGGLGNLFSKNGLPSGSASPGGADTGGFDQSSMPWLGDYGGSTDLGSEMPWLQMGAEEAATFAKSGGRINYNERVHLATGGNPNMDENGNVISWIPEYNNANTTPAQPAQSSSSMFNPMGMLGGLMGGGGSGGSGDSKGGGWGGAAKGATSGAMMGSEVMPGWGTAAGAVLGGLAGYFLKDGGSVPHYDEGGIIDDSGDTGDTYEMASENIPEMGYTMAANMPSSIPEAPTAGSQDITATNNPGLSIANANPQVETGQKPSIGQALVMSGLGTLAGNSPNAMQNIARGGLQGFANYGQQKQAILSAQKEKALEQHQQSMDNKPQMITSGKTIQWLYPQEKDPKTGKKGLLVDSGIPTTTWAKEEADAPLKAAQTKYYENKANDGKFSFNPGMGQDEDGKPVPGTWVQDGKTGEATFKPGMITTGKIPAPALSSILPTTPEGTIDEAKIPPQVEQQAKAMVEGRAPYPSGMMLKQPIYQQALALAQQKDPEYDSATAPARASTYKKFTSGKSADELNALNTSLGHYDSLMSAWKKLDNGDYPIINSVKNKGSKAIGKGEISAFNQARDLLAPELIKAYGASHSVTETERFKENFDPNASPEQQKAVLNMGADLMQSKIQSLQDSYERGMGTVNGFDKISKIGPKGVATLKALGLDTSKYNLPDSSVNAAPTTGTHSTISTPPQSAIDYLKANPNQAQAFEKKYGTAATNYLGQ